MSKILIVDDAAFMRKILRKILIDNGFEVIAEAENADSAINLYKEIRPDLVTMDIYMGKKSGIEAIREIRDFDNNAKIIVCSSLGQEIIVKEAIDLGASDFILKPFKKDRLIKTLKKVLRESS